MQSEGAELGDEDGMGFGAYLAKFLLHDDGPEHGKNFRAFRHWNGLSEEKRKRIDPNNWQLLPDGAKSASKSADRVRKAAARFISS